LPLFTRSVFKTALITLLAAFALAPAALFAQEISPADARAVREVIEAQLDAFAGGELVQPVRMTDAQGRAWIALYPMEQQPDGTWRINGCQLGRLPASET